MLCSIRPWRTQLIPKHLFQLMVFVHDGGGQQVRRSANRRTASRYVSCWRSPWGDFLFTWSSLKNAEQLKTTQILWLKGLYLKINPLRGISGRKHIAKTSCPSQEWAVAGAASGASQFETYVYMYICVCMYIYIYIYVLILCVCYGICVMYVCVYVYIHMYIYIYTYICRERERQRETCPKD